MRKLIAVLAFTLLPIGFSHAQPFCPGVTPWVFDDVQASDPFCGSITWAATSNVTLGCQIIDANHRLYCPDQLVTRKQMVVFMQRLSDHVAPLTCAPGQVMKWNGLAWACSDDNIGGSGGGGTVTSVLAGTGLQASPNPIVGAGSINLAPSYQLPQSCANGQVAKSNGAGGWTCAADNDTNSGGTVMSLTAGTGITLSANPITTTGSIAVNTTTIQARVTGSCAVGSYVRAIAADGTVTCAATIDAYTRAESDTRFFEGSTVRLVAADSTPVANGAALEATLAGISDASAAKPYTVRLAPGVYDVGADGSTVPAFVTLAGAGSDATIVTSSGVAAAGQGTVVLSGDARLTRLTVRNTGGATTLSNGVIGAGAGFAVVDAKIVIQRNGSTTSSAFNVAQPVSGTISGVLDRVDIEIDGGAAIGSQNFNAFGVLTTLTVTRSSIRATGVNSIGIGPLTFNLSNSSLVVTDTTIDILAGGIGVSVTEPASQLYRNVTVRVSGGGGTNRGFTGAGSGFKPVIEDSLIEVSGGSANAGVVTNNGFVRLRGTRVLVSGTGATGMLLTDASSFSATWEVSDSVINATIGIDVKIGVAGGTKTVKIDRTTIESPTAIRTDSGGGGITVRVGASKLAATTNVSTVAGAATVTCVASYDESYAAIGASC